MRMVFLWTPGDLVVAALTVFCVLTLGFAYGTIFFQNFWWNIKRAWHRATHPGEGRP